MFCDIALIVPLSIDTKRKRNTRSTKHCQPSQIATAIRGGASLYTSQRKPISAVVYAQKPCYPPRHTGSKTRSA